MEDLVPFHIGTCDMKDIPEPPIELSATDFLNELKSMSRFYHCHHPLDKLIREQGAPPHVLKCWIANRYYYHSIIPRKDAYIVAKCTDKEFRNKWASRIVYHDKDGGGVDKWLLLANSVGIKEDELPSYLLPGVKFACDAYVNFCRDEDWRDSVCTSLTELFCDDIHSSRVDNWPYIYEWATPVALTYSRDRLGVLPEEKDVALSMILKTYTTKTQQCRVMNLVRFKQRILWSILDSVYMACYTSSTHRMEALLPPKNMSSGEKKIYILGSGAGGGTPQWNCFCSNCKNCRNGGIPPRTQSSLALVHNDNSLTVINTSPDIVAQLNRYSRTYLNGTEENRKNLVKSVILTDANLDHTAGLLSLREHTSSIDVMSTDLILTSISPLFGLLKGYSGVHNPVNVKLNLPIAVGDFVVTPYSMKSSPPPFIRNVAPKDSLDSDFTLFLKIENTSTGRYIVYCPAVAELDKNLRSLIENAHSVLIDGTFSEDTELSKFKDGAETSEQMGHIVNPNFIDMLSDIEVKKYFIHINNTNPMLSMHPNDFQKRIEMSGFEISYDGMEILF